MNRSDSDLADVRFTEEMRGFYLPHAPAYEAGFHSGRDASGAGGTDRRDWSLGFRLTIGTADLARMEADPQHTAEARGWVRCPSLSAKRLFVDSGTFRLFAPGARPGRTAMRYHLEFHDTQWRPYTLSGFKDVAHDRPFDLWRDTTTLYVKLLDGHGPDDGDLAREAGRGILHLTAPMFARQLLTVRGRPRAVARFGGTFAGQLARTYGRPVPRDVRP